MPYQCRHCGGTYCAEHRLPEAHDCPGLENWGDSGAVFDSGFDDSVNTTAGTTTTGSDGLSERLGLDRVFDTRTGGPLAYFRGNVTYLFLTLMWLTFLLQFIVAFLLNGTASLRLASASPVWTAIFTLSPTHPEYVWTWVTSIFAHGGFAHIALNSIVIYFFGRLVEDYIGSKKFAALFIGSGVLAGLAQVGVQIIQLGGIPATPVPGVLGASGAGLAIMGVLTVLNPSLRVYLYFILPVPLWLLTAGYTVITVLSIASGGAGAGGIAQVAHLVGLAVGLAYGQRVKGRRRVPGQIQFGGGPGGPGGPGGSGPGRGRRRGPF
jgi:membrane associated rhomboid family serine protease